MRIQRTLSLLVALLAVLWVSEPASAQRRGSTSQGQSTGSSRSGSVSGGSRSTGSAGGSVTRSGGSHVGGSSGSSVSRGSVSYGRPSGSSGSSGAVGSSGSYGRPTTTTVTRSTSGATYDRSSAYDRSSSGRTTSSPPVIVRSEPRTVDRGESIARDWNSGSGSIPSTGAPSRGSEPVRDGRVIDITDVALPPRVGFPQPVGGQRSAVDSRDLTRELRSRGTSSSLADLRRRSSGAPTQIRTPSISREDILRRYQGSASRTDAFRESPPSRAERDPRLDRREALGRPSLSEGRRGRDGSDSSSASRIEAARAQREAQDASRIARAREEQQARQAERVAAARADYQAKQADRIAKARANYAGSLRDKWGDGDGQGGGGDHGDDWDDGHGGHHGHHDDDCHNHFYGAFWGYYGNYCWGYWGWNWCGPAWCWGWWWHNYWYWGGYWYPHCRPSWYWYGPFLPWHVSVIYQTVDEGDPQVIYVEDPEPEVIYVDQPPAGEQVVVAEDAPAAVQVPVPASGGGVNRAAEYYLSLGDRAFRDGRYADAVHFYAKSVEFAPEEGILYLILSDALFCTGDYHYAAYALRKAFELDPLLATSVVDKRSFYADPAEFDRQVAVLETYLEDHFVDDDARLVLAANYLFGGRPAAAVDLLENPFSAEVKASPAGQHLLEAAKAIQYGKSGAEAESGAEDSER